MGSPAPDRPVFHAPSSKPLGFGSMVAAVALGVLAGMWLFSISVYLIIHRAAADFDVDGFDTVLGWSPW